MRLALSQKSSQYPRSLDANAIKSPSFDWRDNFILNYRSFRIDEDSFLAVLSARLVPQKGIDIALAPMCKLLKQYDKLRLIVMGRFQKTKETQHLAPMIQKLATKFPEKFMFINWFDRDENPIWERLLMAADIFLMPSRTEPCGIAQQRALHYGDIVIASEVGGLSPVPGNTIIRLDPTFIITTPTPVPPNANAISFPLSHPANICSREFRDAVAGFKEAISKAYEIWQNNRPLWETMVDNAMSFENGWDDPIGEYKGIYERLDP
jgi:starch synthase